MVGDPRRLSPRARDLLRGSTNELCASSISAFEIAVKYRKRKLELPLAPRQWYEQTVSGYEIHDLPVTAEIAGLAPEVEAPHADPCDRIIVATAQTHGIPILTSDPLIHACGGVTVIW